MKKVLYTASTFLHITNFHLPYLKWFKDNGFIVHVLAGDGGQLGQEYADKVLPFALKKSIYSLHNWKESIRLAKIIKQEKYDVVSCHTSLAAFFARLAVLFSRHKPTLVVNTAHGYLFDKQTKPLKRFLMLWAEKIMAPLTDLVMVMNNCDLQIAKQNRLAKKIVKITGMGVNLESFPQICGKLKAKLRATFNIPENAFVLLCAAEFSERKNQQMLIQAMDDLPPNVYLLLPGNGALLERCKQLASSSLACDRILFPNYMSNIYNCVAMSDVAVSASRYEGLPFHIMEALSSGLPAIVSDVKGNQDLIKSGINGYVYPFNCKDDFVEKVNTLIMELKSEKITYKDCIASMDEFSLGKAFRIITEHYSKFSL